MLRQEVIKYLETTPPFNLLGRDVLEGSVDAISIEYYPRGHLVLRQNGAPCTALRLIKKGGVKVYVESDEGGEVLIDYRSEGDSFGFVSLMSADKSRANIVTLEDTICYLLPRDLVLNLVTQQPVVRDYFMRSFFVNFIDKTYKEMRSRSFSFGEGDKLLFTTPVRNLISKEVVTARPTVSVREAAEVMSRHRISSLVLVDDQKIPVGIITDRDLRDKVVAKGLDPFTGVSEIMSPPFVRVDGAEAAFEALLKMIKHNIHHLLVIDGGILRGVVTNHDFMLIQGTSPLSLLKDIEGQQSIRGLANMGDRIGRIISLLVKEGVKALNITRVITELNDRVLARIVELVQPQIGKAPAAFAFGVYGGEGRRELTFKNRTECAVVYHAQKTPIHEEEMRAYADRLISAVGEALKVCGLPAVAAEPLGGGSRSFGNVAEWEGAVENGLQSKHIGIASAAARFLDLRIVSGDESVVESFRDRMFYRIRNNRDLLGHIMRLAVKQRSPIGFFKTFVVERGGEHHDRLNLRDKGVMPLVNCLRALAVAGDIRETSTVGRLSTLAEGGVLARDLQADVLSAFQFLLHLRIQDQLSKRQFGEPADEFIDLDTLSLLEKKTLKEVFRIIARLQEAVEEYFARQEVALP